MELVVVLVDSVLCVSGRYLVEKGAGLRTAIIVVVGMLTRSRSWVVSDERVCDSGHGLDATGHGV